MSALFFTLGLGITAYVATNLDNLFLLAMLFSIPALPARRVIIGQYVGFSVLIGISLLGRSVGMLFPPAWIGWMGLLPIAIGLRSLGRRDSGGELEEEWHQFDRNVAVKLRGWMDGTVLSVAAMTVASGGDNIGVYVPLFARSTPLQVALFILVFLGMTAVWCAAAFFLVHNRIIGAQLQRQGRLVLPFIWIALGFSLLARAHAINLVPATPRGGELHRLTPGRPWVPLRDPTTGRPGKRASGIPSRPARPARCNCRAAHSPSGCLGRGSAHRAPSGFASRGRASRATSGS
jgi:cadmium resistance protein CadD (predicted permease)